MKNHELMDLLSNLNLRRLRWDSKGEELAACCPFHEENKPSFAVNNEKGVFNCFGCHATGPLPLLVARLKRISVDEALVFIDKYGQYDNNSFNNRDMLSQLFNEPNVEQTKLAVVRPSQYAPYVTLKRILKAREYLETRGVVYRKSGTVTTTCHIPGYDPVQKRVLFPWYNDINDFYGCTGRINHRSEQPRYMPYFGLQRSEHLFFGHAQWRRLNGIRAYVIVEGEIDAIRVSQLHKKTGIVAFALGNSRATKIQCSMLNDIGGPYIVALDNDYSGDEGAVWLERMLQKHNVVSRIQWPLKDAGTCDDKQIVSTLGKANWLGL